MFEVGGTTAVLTRSSNVLMGTSCVLRAAEATGDGAVSDVSV